MTAGGATWWIWATPWIWLALEVGLRIRDRITGRGSTGRDGATRRTIMLMIVPAILAATAVSYLLPAHSPLRLPSSGSGSVPWPVAAGMAVMWLGLTVRTWAIVVLGRSFRTTVEIDADQPVVERGPYRWVRHPAYTGVLLLAAGYGLALGNWPSLLITLAVPAVAMLRRIGVEEAALVETLGQPYQIYRTHTKRLVPGLW
jgi:protein-S-isoprenylcysteine O-methyltransferase Ste14